jgi:hypothetical protein
MAQQTIDTEGSADTLKSGFDKVNANFTELYERPVPDTEKLHLSGHSLTGSATTSQVQLAAAWDTTGAPALIAADVTDTASHASAKLLDLKVGGASKFSIGKAGSFEAGPVKVMPGDGYGWKFVGTDWSGTQVYSTWGAWAILGVMQVGEGYGSPYYSGMYKRPADDVHEFHGDTAAQVVRVYKTRSDAANHERVKLGWNGSAFEIKPEAAGTGSVRQIHISGLPTSNPGPGILWNDGGTVKVGT